MASAALRTRIWAVLREDPTLQAIGYGPDTIYPNYSPDSPPSHKFIVLRWGPTTPGVGGCNSTDLGIWAYCRDADYGPIEAALMRCRSILAPLVGTRLSGGGAILGLDWAGTGADLFDDAYQAYVRPENWTATASGN